MSSPNTIIAVPQTRWRGTYQPVAGIKGLYTLNGVFYERPTIDRRQTWRKLNSTTPAAAQKEMFRRRDQLAKHLAGEAGVRHPYKQSEVMSVADLCDFYIKSGCPKRRNIDSARTSQTLREEKTRVEMLKSWWGDVPFENIELGDCKQYAAWRKNKIRLEHAERWKDRPAPHPEPPAGDRQIDKELITLSQVFWWAQQNSKRTGIDRNPLAHDRPKFQNEKLIKHCRDFMPENGDELHALARMLFQVERSEVLGWQTLFQAMIGPRAHEILRLRFDAQNKKQAGHIAGDVLYLYNSTTSKGTFEHIKIHAALAACMEAHRKWHAERFPQSPWFFPSPADPQNPVGSTALTHALDRIGPALNIPKRTSHGLRAFYVNVLRSRGMADAQVALRIGQKTGGKLIVDVYGACPENELSWFPAKSDPAWETFEEPVQYVQTELGL